MTRRLLFCTQTAHVHGGLETWLDEIVPFLERRGWDVTVGLARGRRFHDPAAYRAAHPHFATVEIDGRLGTREARVAALRKVLQRTRPDIVVPINIADALEAVARAKLGGDALRQVVMLRAQVPHGELEDIRRYRDFIDLAVGGNRLLRSLIAEWAKFPPERLQYIPPGSRRKTAGSRTPKPADRIRIGYVGRVEEREKRALDLIEFTRALERRGVAYELTVAGDGPARDALARGLAGRARLLGNVSVDELYRSIYPNLDLLVLFSTAEAGPQVVWQAMHYGVVPVVSRYRGARAEGVLRDGETAMMFDVGDPETAAAHVARLASDRKLMGRIAATAEACVDPEYLLGHSFERWLTVFEEVMEMPVAVGAVLPPLPASGALERLRIHPSIALAVRRLLGRLPEPRDPGDEWPHHGPLDAETAARIDALARALDA